MEKELILKENKATEKVLKASLRVASEMYLMPKAGRNAILVEFAEKDVVKKRKGAARRARTDRKKTIEVVTSHPE